MSQASRVGRRTRIVGDYLSGAAMRPACTFVEVSRFIDPEWLVEFEVHAIIAD